jgi:hypothetical protein
LEALARIPNVSAAARVVGIPRSTAYDHAHADPVFATAWREAIEIGIDLMERLAHQRATTGWEQEETRRRVKRIAVAGEAELVVVEDETVTVTRNEVSDQMMTLLLKAYRPGRFRDQVEHRMGPADGLDVQPVGPEDDGIHRMPTRERMLELARLAVELERGVAPVIDTNGKPVDGA